MNQIKLNLEHALVGQGHLPLISELDDEKI